MRSVKEFEAALVGRLRSSDPPGNVASEGDLERRFILPLVCEILNEDSGPHVCAHPWNQAETCEPNCAEGRGLVEQAELHGCPDCWSKSKEWAAVRLYGLHCFDLVVGDRTDSFVLELKLLRRAPTGNRRANDGFQRLLGQCLLARLIHPSVVAFCVAESGALDDTVTSHVSDLHAQGITLIVKTLADDKTVKKTRPNMQPLAIVDADGTRHDAEFWEKVLENDDLPDDELIALDPRYQPDADAQCLTVGVEMTRTCKNCGTTIPVARLQALPETSWCVTCAEPKNEKSAAVHETVHRFSKKPGVPRGYPRTKRRPG